MRILDSRIVRNPWFSLAGWGLALLSLLGFVAVTASTSLSSSSLNDRISALQEDLDEAEELREEYSDDAVAAREEVNDLEIELTNLRADYEELQDQLTEAPPPPEETAPAKPPKPPEPSGTIPADGIWQAGPGGDFPPGTYRAPGGGQCYWARLRSPNPNDIIVNGLGPNPTVEIAPHDWFETRSCGEWEQLG